MRCPSAAPARLRQAGSIGNSLASRGAAPGGASPLDCARDRPRPAAAGRPSPKKRACRFTSAPATGFVWKFPPDRPKRLSERIGDLLLYHRWPPIAAGMIGQFRGISGQIDRCGRCSLPPGGPARMRWAGLRSRVGAAPGPACGVTVHSQGGGSWFTQRRRCFPLLRRGPGGGPAPRHASCAAIQLSLGFTSMSWSSRFTCCPSAKWMRVTVPP